MNTIHILLVEDNEGDVMLMQDALEETKNKIKISIARDGKEALDFLNRQGEFAAAALPDFILLDVNLPKKNGHEVLQYIKENKNLRHIPVIMLSTSSMEKDVNRCYNNYANCYITKPVDATEFTNVIISLESFWACTVKLPTNNRNDKG